MLLQKVDHLSPKFQVKSSICGAVQGESTFDKLWSQRIIFAVAKRNSSLDL